MSGSRAAESAASPLAHRPDLCLGAATVRPSLRSVEGPDGSITTEPRVMQVLLALADAGGAVLSRDDLMRLCWGGAVVGDDSVNRAVAEIRRLARTTGAGFGVRNDSACRLPADGGHSRRRCRSCCPRTATPGFRLSCATRQRASPDDTSAVAGWRRPRRFGRRVGRPLGDLQAAARSTLSRTDGSRQAGPSVEPARAQHAGRRSLPGSRQAQTG